MGSAQVMLQPKAATGALFLAAILVGSLGYGGSGHMAVFWGALMCLMAATAISHGRKDYEDGLLGFNAILVGCAAMTFLSNTTAVRLLTIGAALSTLPLKHILDKVFRFTGISSLTFPFILASWLVMVIAALFGLPPYAQESIVLVPEISATTLLEALLKGLSQVFLIDSWIGGLLIAVGLLVASSRAALLAFAGSAIGIAMAFAIGAPWSEICIGLWGFSPALTAIAIGDTFRSHFRHTAVATIVATVITTLIQYALVPLSALTGMLTLTLPFCIATWLTVSISKQAKL